MKRKIIAGKTEYIDLLDAYVLLYPVSDSEVVLIDSGLKVFPELIDDFDARGLTVCAVLCTHPHIDHIANNRLLVEHYGAKIYASEIDVHNVNERNWSFPNWDEPYTLIPIPTGADSVTIGDVSFGVMETPGHTLGHLAYVTPDDVCFLGDAMMSEKALALAKLPYMDYVDPSIKTMLKIGESGHAYYALSHKGVIKRSDLKHLVEINVRKEIALYHMLEGMITEQAALETQVTEFLKALQVSEKYLSSEAVRWTARIRILELVRSGALQMKHGIVAPGSRQQVK